MNDRVAVRASPVASVTVAVTLNSNAGSPARSAVGAASGVNATAKRPSASVVVSPSVSRSSSYS